MKLIRDSRQMHVFSTKVRRAGRTIGLVPTMGYLHEGHLSLARRARRDTDIVVMSIFVNPAQFGPKEDLKKYPRDLKRDIKLAKGAGVDVIFYPSAEAMYPDGYKTYVGVRELSDILCGRSRPGHFTGVATVVAKLFNIVECDVAYFGQKDAQQALIIKKMSADLNMPLKIKVMPIIREKDGLAMSSRNKYLSPGERRDAAVLHKALLLAKSLVKRGRKAPAYLVNRMKDLVREKKSARIDYIDVVDARDLSPVKSIQGKVLILLAVWIGKTRLIDNIIING
ncbi:MAG: pantoate--beta-alanine ligase [Candidatus Omnitrophica bacterium]|nr:pantoate--beta-alanine ligase [Candidatus Omnitrophota bacterium]